jgi:transcriptional regulator with XRE-family HTH domain
VIVIDTFSIISDRFVNLRICSVITGNQIKAARALIGWSQDELAKRAGVGVVTVKRFETSDVLMGTLNSLRKVEAAFSKAGVEFILPGPDGGPGVRMQR